MFTDCAVALTRSMFPQSASPKLRTFQSPPSFAPGKVLGEFPSKRSSSVCPSSSAATSVNGLKVEPGWRFAVTARLYWLAW